MRHLALLGLTVIVVTGCGCTLYPVTTGSHTTLENIDPAKPRRVVVWGNHPAVVNAVTQYMHQSKLIVIERARLKEVLNEQKIRLTNTPDDEADLLRVGRLIGADWIVFAEANINSAEERGASVDAYGGKSYARTVYHLSVSVRNVSVETGEIRWSGTATYPRPITNPEQGLVYLTNWAVARALCPVESGYNWTDKDGCQKSDFGQTSAKGQ